VWRVTRTNPHIRAGLVQAGFTGGWLSPGTPALREATAPSSQAVKEAAAPDSQAVKESTASR
jgi:hypothetical protein